MDGSLLDRVDEYLALTHEQRIDVLAALQVEKARLAAQEQLLLHAVAVDPPLDGPAPELDKHWAREEVACVLRVSSMTASARIATAQQLVTRLPATLAALSAGQVSFSHVLRLTEATAALPDEVTSQVEAQVLPRAAEQTVGQFGAAIRRALARFDTRDSETKHRRAAADRRVEFYAQPDGMASLWALLPADAAAAIEDAVREAAAQCRGLDERTADQRRADALTDLILGPLLPDATRGGTAGPPASGAAGVGGLRPSVHVTVSISTLLGLDEQAGELRGHGPIPAVLARALAFDPTGTWRRILADGHGQYLEAGAHTYRPAAGLARHVRLRDDTCRFPGCRRSSQSCELDHLVAWADGGRTVPENLHAVCPRHHHLKHETRWRVQRHPDGASTWTAPTGHRYRQPPPDPLPVDTTMALVDEPPPF